jgi:hypothetical protein
VDSIQGKYGTKSAPIQAAGYPAACGCRILCLVYIAAKRSQFVKFNDDLMSDSLQYKADSVALPFLLKSAGGVHAAGEYTMN